nr:DUF2189 domain-containing protein [uncultured Halomonas sp.]
MMVDTNKNISTPRGSQLTIHRVTVDHPRRWLMAGIDDFRRVPVTSLIYGLIWVAVSMAITVEAYLLGLWHWLPALLGGFMFVGPLVAVGCYGISRRLGQGQQASLGDALKAWTSHTGQLAMIGLMLLLFFVAWFNLSMMLFALFFGLAAPSPEALLIAFFTTAEGYGMMLTGTVLGGSLAFGAFAISVVAIPTLMDRDLTFMEGIEASVKSVTNNFRVMLLWALILTGCTILGFVTFYLGLAVILPVLGYASWHAYEDLVGGDHAKVGTHH